jgi:hypothetical protein
VVGVSDKPDRHQHRQRDRDRSKDLAPVVPSIVPRVGGGDRRLRRFGVTLV